MGNASINAMAVGAIDILKPLLELLGVVGVLGFECQFTRQMREWEEQRLAHDARFDAMLQEHRDGKLRKPSRPSSADMIAGLKGGSTPGNPDPRGNRPDDNLNNVDPNNLPDGWTRTIDHAGRTHIRDASGRYRIRIDPATKGHPLHRHHYNIHGQPIDIHGHPTRFGVPNSHIPMR